MKHNTRFKQIYHTYCKHMWSQVLITITALSAAFRRIHGMSDTTTTTPDI